MKQNRSKNPNNQIEHNTTNLRKVFKVISSSILIISLGLAVFLPFRQPAVDPALAAPVPGVPIDSVTLVDVWETSEYQTDNDPTDDSIEYVHTAGTTASDSFEYEICDGAGSPVCVAATVNITVSSTTLAATVESPQTLSAEAINAPIPTTDNATVVINSWVNIDVLSNDDWGVDGPGTGAIRLGTDCENGSVAGDCLEPTKGEANVNTGPRSPDPTGLAYLDGHTFPDFTDRLLISDSEVNEIYPPNPAAFTGDNLFLTDLSGGLVKTLTTLFDPDPDPPVYSDEPTGVAYNPANDHLFFTDDRRDRIFEVDPGPDGDYDIIETNFKCSWIGCGDPSGITFDTLRGHLIIVDDAGEEVYDIDLGSNGTLDREDAWTSFDTTIIGVSDPEGIEFNPDNGHLYILSSAWDGYMAETTIDGKLLRYLDTPSVSGLDTPAGLAYIPQGNGSNKNTIYIVDRGDDNNPPTVPIAGPVLLAGDPMENDGKLFKVTIPRNAPPFVDAGLDQTIALPNSASLDGTVIDDGWPKPPGSFTTDWSKVSGPGLVTFGDASVVDTTASFDTPGTYILNLEADDGGAHLVNDQVTIEVLAEPLKVWLPLVIK
jgi:hypothetical protein